MTANPYEAPSTESDSRTAPVWRFPYVAIQVYPMLLLASFYGTWLIAWISLGHPPRPSLDDPKAIGPAVDVASFITMIFLVGFPIAMLLGLFSPLLETGPRWSKKLLGLALTACLWSMTIALLRWDPWLVIMWFMD